MEGSDTGMRNMKVWLRYNARWMNIVNKMLQSKPSQY